MINFNKILQFVDLFIWSICLTVFAVGVIGYYYSNAEFYRPFVEYAGFTWLIWPIMCGMVKLIIKAIKDIKKD